jgi:hypothetical protein
MKYLHKRIHTSEAVFNALAEATKPMSVARLKRATNLNSLSVLLGICILNGRGWVYITNSLTSLSSGPYTESALYGLSYNGLARLEELQRQTA